MKKYSDISFRYMKENKKRTALTIFGIALATVLIFAIGTFLLSFRDSMIAGERADQDYEFSVKDISSEQTNKLINNAEIKDTSIVKNDSTIYEIKDSDVTAFDIIGNKDYYNKIFNNDIVEGNLPEKNNEIVIDYYSSTKLNKKVGDEINLIDENGNELVYKISGIYKTSAYSVGNAINVYTYFDNIDNESNYIVWLNLKSDKDKNQIINNVLNNIGISVNEENFSENSTLLYLTGNGGNEYIVYGLENVALIVIGIIIVCTATVIYNSFNISVIERIKYFGILKSIGATNKQIRNIIYKEGFFMGLIALPIGCVVGFLSLKYGIKLFIGDELLYIDFKVGFYPIIILITLILEVITIFISLLGPTRKIKKISAIDAMRNKNEIKVGKIKKRKNRIIGKVFGIEGSIAYKNIRRTPARFIITLVALTISIVLFNVFFTFMNFTTEVVKNQFMNIPFDAQLSKNLNEGFLDEEINNFEEQSFLKDMYRYYKLTINQSFPSDKFTDRYDYVEENNGTKDILVNYYVGAGEKEINIAKDYVVEGSLDYDKLEDDGVILIDGEVFVDADGKKKVERYTNYKVGDTIKIPKGDNEYYEAKVVAILDKDIFYGVNLGNQISFVFLNDVYERLVQPVNYNTIGFNYINEDEKLAALKYFDDMSTKNDYVYGDIGDMMEEVNSVYAQIEFFVYSFIIVITVIAIVNIFNTISTNLLLRKKEFSTLKAIGMTEVQLNKSVILEGTLYGIIAAIVGGIISIILSKLMITVGSTLGEFEYNFPYVVFSLSVICAILVTYISTLVPLRRLKKITIVEGISDEE